MAAGRILPLVWLLAVCFLFCTACDRRRPADENQSASFDSISSQDRQDDVTRFKIVCWNVLYGFNRGKAVNTGSQWLSDQNPDVVALQELNGNTAKSFSKLAMGWGHVHSVILKERGFPVGLTSRMPIEVLERRIDGFHHGFLHCKTSGIHFFVVHFWPGKEHEADVVLEKARSLVDSGERVVVLGDFNSNSRQDAEFLKSSSAIKPRYEVVDWFESHDFVDLVRKHDRDAKFSAPSPITIPRWSRDMDEIKSKRQRIDFVFAGPLLESNSTSATIVVNERVEKISDHYPVVVELSGVSN